MDSAFWLSLCPCDFILLIHKWSVSSGQLQVAMSCLCGSFQQVPPTHYRTPMPKSTTMDGDTMDGFLLCYGVGLASPEGRTWFPEIGQMLSEISIPKRDEDTAKKGPQSFRDSVCKANSCPGPWFQNECLSVTHFSTTARIDVPSLCLWERPRRRDWNT